MIGGKLVQLSLIALIISVGEFKMH